MSGIWEVDGGVAVRMRRLCLFALIVATITGLAGCSGGSSVSKTTVPPAVSIAFNPVPPTSITVGTVTSMAAVVCNDANNYGVDWSLTCQTGAGTCGSISPVHTASGASTTYTPPTTLSGNSLTGINIVALATADPTVNVVAPLTITAFGSTLKGTYVLQAQGIDPSLFSYEFAGVLVLDGNGSITAGEQTVNTALVSTTDQGLTGTYFVGNDGRGTLTINDPNTAIGLETFAFIALSESQNPRALISQLDLGSAATGASATGTMDLQTSTTPPTGGYAFVVNGTNVAKTVPLAIGGVFNIDSPNTISGNGSVADEILSRKVNASAATLFGTLSNPDSFGMITVNLTAPFGNKGQAVPIQLTGYIVDDTHIRIVESDSTAVTPGFGVTGGIAVGQGAATGTFRDNTAFSGTHVFGVPGVDLSSLNTSFLPSTLSAAGSFTADGSGNLSNGFTDVFLLLNCVQTLCTHDGIQGAQISAAFSGTYAVDITGTGRTSITLGNFTPAPQHGYLPLIIFYLTGNGNPALILQAGDSHYPSLGTGFAHAKGTGVPTFGGDYGFSFSQQSQSTGSENDGTAQMNVNSSGTPQISGIADANLGGSPSLGNGFLGSFSAPTLNMPFAGTLYADPNAANQSVFPLAPTPPMTVNYYAIDAGRGFFVETDLVNATSPSAQVSFGYYETRIPVCDGCP